MVRDTYEKVNLIQKRLLMAQSRQKSYAERRQLPLEFEVEDNVFLKVMPKRGMVRFEKQGKLSLRYIGPSKILERVGTIIYRFALPPSLSGVHAVFHISVVDWGKLDVDTDGTFEEGSVCIMDNRDQVLQWKTVRLVKVLWKHRGVEEATWESEDTMRTSYPFLFDDKGTLFNHLIIK